MSLQIEWPEGSEPLATNSGWSDFGRWAESLDPKYARIKQLYRAGITSTAEQMSVELEHALTHSPPDDPTVRKTADNLLRVAEKARAADYLAITDGMGEGEGEDEWDEEAAEYDPQPAQVAEAKEATKAKPEKVKTPNPKKVAKAKPVAKAKKPAEKPTEKKPTTKKPTTKRGKK